MKYPANQIEFDDMFNTGQGCIDYLSLLRCPNGFECPQCGSIRYWDKNKGRNQCIDCSRETTVTSNTLFHRTSKHLRVWLHAIWWMVAQKNGVIPNAL